MNFKTFFASKTGIKLAILLSRSLSSQQADRFIRTVVYLITRRRHAPLIRTIRANQSVIRNIDFDSPLLDEVPYQVLYRAGQGYYDLYRTLTTRPQMITQMVEFRPQLLSVLEQAAEQKRGMVISVIHTSNFDLAAAAFAHSDFDIQMLTYANPTDGHELQNELRTNDGYVVTPVSKFALKMALKRLQAGGVVLTGIDRPLPIGTEKRKKVCFFGRLAALPTGHIRLAMSTNSLLVFVHTERTKEGKYYVHVQPPIELIRTGNRQKDILSNAEQLLALAEEKIRAKPEEWMMFNPVWPEVLDDELGPHPQPLSQ